MQTVTQRPRPQQSGNESAAIAITAKLLCSLKTGAADAIHLIPSSDPLKYSEYGQLYASNASDSSFQRRHGSSHGTTWFGFEKQIDQQGRTWERHYHAVVDDFGDLVEVPA